MNQNIELKIKGTVVGEAARLDLKFSTFGFRTFAFFCLVLRTDFDCRHSL